MKLYWIGFIFLLVPSVVFAADLRSGDEVMVPQTETVADDVYAAGGSVNVAGAVQGDLNAAGGNILMSGSVTQDANIAGGNISVIGNVGDDLRVAGGSIIVQGKVGGDLVIGGGQVTVAPGAQIVGDVVVGGGQVSLNGSVGKNVRASGGEITINAPVLGFVESKTQMLRIGSAAVIGGYVHYESPQEAQIAQGAQIKGEVVRTPVPGAEGWKAAWAGIIGGLVALKLLMGLIAALFLGLFFRRFSTEVVNIGLANFGFEMLRGFIALILMPIAAGILFATVVGIPLGVVVLFAWILILIIASIFSSIVAGSLIHKWFRKPEGYVVNWKTIVLGSVVLGVVTFIPFIGWLIRLAFVLIALGAIVKFKSEILRDWR